MLRLVVGGALLLVVALLAFDRRRRYPQSGDRTQSLQVRPTPSRRRDGGADCGNRRRG